MERIDDETLRAVSSNLWPPNILGAETVGSASTLTTPESD